MSDPNATQALQAAIDAANPQLTDGKEQVTPAVTEVPDVEDLEGAEGDEGDDADQPEVVTDENGEPLAEQPRRKSRKERARERFNAETARRIKAEQELADLKRQRDHAERAQSQSLEEGIDEVPKTLKDFEFKEDQYTDYLADQKFKRKLREERSKEEAKRVKQAEDGFVEKAAKFREEATDFDEVALNTPLGPRYTQDIIEAIRDGDTGPQLAYYLGQNLAETEKLLDMPAAQRARAIGKIEAKLESAAAPAARTTTTAAVAQPPRTVTRAPAIGSTVHAASPGKKALADWDIKDHIEKIRVKR
jgi:hypothetical protein